MLKITKKKQKKTMTLYIDVALIEAVDELAKTNNVSTNSLLCDLIQHGVDQARTKNNT